MALIRTIQDAKKYLRLSQLADSSSLPDVEAAELLNIVPIIGQALYDKLNADYGVNNPPAAPVTVYQVAHLHIQRISAALSYAEDLGTYQTLITDAGVRTMGSDSMQPAHNWEFKALKENLMKKAARGIELLLRHLIKNVDTIPEYKDSNEYKRFATLAIRSAEDFNFYYRLHDPYRTYFLLHPIIADVQERYIVPVIGRELLKWMLGRSTAIITVDNVQIDMMTAFKKAIVQFTLKHAMVQQTVRFDVSGVTIQQSGDQETENAGRADADNFKFVQMQNELENEGQNWLRDLTRYMNGAYAGEFDNDFDESFDTAFLLGPLAPSNDTEPVLLTKNGERKIFVLGG